MTDILSSKALVTGATSGIGRAVALKLASDGFEVIVHGRDAERGAQTVKEIERSGGQARFLPADRSVRLFLRTLVFTGFRVLRQSLTRHR